ncbi:GAF domain-containing protein [Spirulina sp. CS-785/01]|uniref:GAF domain-containing protein n=1 Tax=Spirulina sp. CS-785/01 TaxID=3021716 RepID=UPI0023309351|nr:GAF domain-containing protein [Spirulina sp. CS-785/01]MDB9314275.1 GAF domain-containing protein [Spirulina sp. CS-785/01]
MSVNSFPSSSDLNGEGLPLTSEMLETSHNYKKLLGLVLEWTGKEPFLTQMLFKTILDSQEAPIPGKEPEWVENFVRSRLLKNWENNPKLKPVWHIRDRLLKNKDKRRSLQLLEFYEKVLNEEIVFTDNSSEQKELQLLGLIAKHRGRLTVHNRIYREIFNEDWIKKAKQTLSSQIDPNDEQFLRAFTDLEHKLLSSQNEIISSIENGNHSSTVSQPLYEVLRDVTTKVGQIVGADRTSIFLLNDDKTELWSLVAEDESGQFLDIHVPVGEGIAGLVAKHKQVIHIADNVYDDPRSQLVKESDKKFNYKTKNILAFPILNDNLEIIAVVQLLNKIPQPGDTQKGFSHQDLERLAKCVIPIRRILETCQSCYEGIKKAQANAALAKATRSLDQVNLDTKMILTRVMDAAKELLNADRSTLWLYDDHRGDLWTELPKEGVIRCPVGIGYAGQVAKTREPVIIPYDLYKDPNAENAKRTDAKTHYRTCSLLCMPILSPDGGDLLGVTQLVNKRKSGYENVEYDQSTYPQVPAFFKASFDKNDRQSMQIFNERVGAILQFAKAHETLKESTQSEPQTAVQQTLALLSDLGGKEQPGARYNALYSLLNFTTTSLKRLFQVEYSHVFLVDDEKQQLWTLMLGGEKAQFKMLHIPTQKGIASKVLAAKEAKRSEKIAQIKDQLIRSGIPPQKQDQLKNILLFPIVNEEGQSVAVLRLLNKKTKPGFTTQDITRLKAKTEIMLPVLQALQAFHQNQN